MKFSAKTALRLLLVKFANAPFRTTVEVGRRLLPAGDNPQVRQMREVVREAPLVLEIETASICNARCAFCAYPSMKREKGVMDLSLFERILQEYGEMGGGPVSLTPMAGDALLDPHLLDRLRLLEASPHVPQVSMTTNGIALERYSDDEVRRMLEAMDCIQLSIGGLDRKTYREMYGVDRFPQVQDAMERLLTLKKEVKNPALVLFAFRTADWMFELRYRKQIAAYRRRGAFVSHIWTYANYAGLLEERGKVRLEISGGNVEKCQTCIYAAVHMAVSWDGKVTACGCTDFEVSELRIGQIGEESLGEIWSGRRRRRILESFEKGALYRICRDCSAYKADSGVFSSPMCRGIRPHAPLPAEYFKQFWGG